MSIIALPTRDVSIVSLIAAGHPAPPKSLLNLPVGTPAAQIAVRADTAAQRSLTAAAIDRAMLEADRRVLLVAHGIGCAAAAWWARLSPRPYVERVAGALLIAPDSDGSDGRAFASPRSALPFPTLVLGATDAAQRLSDEWGARLIDGPLPAPERTATRRLHAMILRFTGAIVERDAQQARRLLAMIGDS
ncbi:RBBP9/YdeN family alpha/beta hydrolase [Sphingomonas floccifaciens]|uniref:RBBP9/YdeN family alpha/beta hydrolase n=1 Tax=Sphingomonas floccifaciens TaxID=1844115 RepID=A0ABW4NA05_9SPHN